MNVFDGVLQINCEPEEEMSFFKIIHWPFKSGTNFLITSLGIVGLSFWSYSIYSETKFNQPIIGESIKMLGKQVKIKELVGYPLAYSFSLGNRFVEKQADSYYSFNVNGPRSKISVEMTTTTLPASDLYVYDQSGKHPKISEFQFQMRIHEDRIAELDQEIKHTPKQERPKLELAKVEEANSILDLKRKLVEFKYDLIDKKKRFFVPDKRLYTLINDPRSKNNQDIIQKDELLTGVNDLVITLPNRTKMIVLPEPKKSFEEKLKIVQETKDIEQRVTVATLNKKISIDVSEFTKEEIKEYGTQKTNFMYSKYSSIRMMSIMIFMGLLVALVVYKKKTTLKSITGSILQEEVKRMAVRNPKVRDILGAKNKNTLQFDYLVGGGMANNHFKCVMYINNLTNGRLEFEGKYIPDQNVYEYNRFMLKYRQKEQKKEVDLLAM